ncbi:MAG: ABC transporter ATP-binding protein [Acidobacteriaceae bacterium]|nr:ABC transporter ATP-binding protein [Acidobacteriaceae bacterium]MBV8569337.1 ABC transporter ATP-binding protein [Acidobacteriaceae bacterium]
MATPNFAQDRDSAPAAIEVRNLVKRYPKSASNAVDGVSFEVGRGEIFGLLGPNGAGKTTIIGALTTFIVPTAGSASIMGFDVAHRPIDVKQRIAVVPQQSNLDRSLKVREILTFHAAYHGTARRQREMLADKLLEELGLGDRKNEKVNRYSGGMSQRIMIARALMHEPDVLFLDEPTNNLDPQSRLFLWERIRDLNAKGLTILLTTHDMDEADRLCQRIAVMDHGKILVNDTPRELKKLIPGGTVLEVRAYARPTESTRAGELLIAALRDMPGVTKVDEVADDAPEPTQAGAGQFGGPGAGRSPAPVPPQSSAPANEPGILSYRVYADSANALIGPVAQAVVSCGAEVRDLSVKQPTLEEVFIFLTGRHLR